MEEKEEYALPGRLLINDVESKLDDIWLKLRNNEADFRQIALERGISPDELEAVLSNNRSDIFPIRQSGSGIDPLTTEIIIIIVKSVAPIAVSSLWKWVIEPYIERALGERPVKKDDNQAT